MLEGGQTKYHNKQALESIGIAHQIINPRIQQMDTDITFIKEVLIKTINKMSKSQQSNNAEHSTNTPSNEVNKTEQMTRKILVAITNVQIESKKSPEMLKIEELTKLVDQ